MEEDLSLTLSRIAMGTSQDFLFVKKKILTEIAELCYQDGNSVAKEKFQDICLKAIERGNKLLKVIESYLRKKDEKMDIILPLSSVIQQSSGKEIVWLWSFENGKFEIFTLPINEAAHLSALGKARIIPSLELTIS